MTAERIPEPEGVHLSETEIAQVLEDNQHLVERLSHGDIHALDSLFEAAGARVVSSETIGVRPSDA